MLKNYTCHGVADKRSRKELKFWQRSYSPSKLEKDLSK